MADTESLAFSFRRETTSKRYPLRALLRDHLQNLIENAVSHLVATERLGEVARTVPVEITDTKNAEHGDYACNFAMVASKRVGMNPRQLGELLRETLLEQSPEPFAAVEIAGPGFLNLKLKAKAISRYVPDILNRGADLAKSVTSAPQRINVEFVSVNPNGPITVGSGRGAAFGDTLSRVLAAVGNHVDREYYINDGVNSEQMKLFAESVRALALGNPLPEKGYKGEYVADIADRLLNPDTHDLLQIEDSLKDALASLDHHLNDADSVGFRSERLASLRSTFLTARDQLRAEIDARDFSNVAAEVAESMEISEDSRAALRDAVEKLSTEQVQKAVQEWMVERQRGDLAVFGVEFQRWFSEQSLHDANKVTEVMAKLEAAGNAYRATQPRDAGEVEADEEAEANPKDGEALWVASHTNGFGDDKDRVLVRADGRPAYIAADVAYLDNKLGERAYDRSLLILGPDHHGYIGRMYAVYQALGYPMKGDKPERFEIVIFQIVRFVKDGKPAPMRKRDGNIYELRDLVDELGKAQAPDATQEEQRRIGADVARFFYLMRSHDTHMDFDIDLATKQSDENPVFYAQYAHARICSVLRKAEEAGLLGDADTSLLVHPRELSLIKKIMDLPTEVQRSAKDYGVHRLTTYAVELARTYHHFYDACRVVQADEPALSRARATLCQAARQALRATFDLLGVSAPERMEREARRSGEEKEISGESADAVDTP